MTILDEIEAAIPALRRYAHALTRDRDQADDLVQDTLERAIARRESWRGDGAVQGWLFRILLNRWRDLQRSPGAPRHLVPIEELPDQPGLSCRGLGALSSDAGQTCSATAPGPEHRGQRRITSPAS